VAFLRDWGTCLDLHLYEEALTHFLGGGDAVVAEANVVTDGRRLGTQRVRLTGRATAFKITALPDRDRRHFEDHTRRFLQHTDSNPSTGSTSPEPPSPSPPSPNNIKDRPPRRQLMPTVLGLLPRRRAAACGRDSPSDRDACPAPARPGTEGVHSLLEVDRCVRLRAPLGKDEGERQSGKRRENFGRTRKRDGTAHPGSAKLCS